jgi:hypothetical protein
MPTHKETIDHAKAAFLQAKSQLSCALANVSEERLNWSPSPSARTPIQIVAHCATAIKYIHQQMDGTPFNHKTTAEADAAFRAEESAFQSREQALEYLETVSASYLAFLGTLTDERLDATEALPFGLGVLPVREWLGAAPGHTQGHVAQLEYLQTINGDRDWRLG